MTNHAAHYPTDALFKGLKALLTSLPSEEEKGELIRTLSEAQSFLEEFRLLVEAVPSMESSRDFTEGLSRLDILVERAGRDAGLRRLLGLRRSTPAGARKATTRGDANVKAGKLERELIHLEISDVVASLEQSAEPLAVLSKLAARLGMRTRSKERKSQLIKRIATHIENQRGYRLLRGEDSGAAGDAPSKPSE